MLPRKGVVVVAVLWLWIDHVVTDSDFITQEVKYVWPVTLWSVPLVPGVDASVSWAEKLADMGVSAFDRYTRDILPVELEADPVFAAEFREADASRMNNAFTRWQKRVYSDTKRVSTQELSEDGSPIPKYKGLKIPYKWKDFYNSNEYKWIRQHIERLASMYMMSMGNEETARGRFRTFIWFEIYKFADAHRPHAHTGNAVTGTFFARYASDENSQKYAFEDPRGINPPFGRSYQHQPQQGEILFYPSWASHFITPHLGNSSNVFLNFVCWPPGGATDLDWEDDATGDFTYTKTFNIKRPKAAKALEGPNARHKKTEL